MSRKHRICLENVTYHTHSRCIEKKPLMRSEKIKELMIFVLNRALKKYHFELSGYTIMDNHFHFYIKTLKDGETISRIMQFIKAQFSRRYNRLMNRTGPFWNERFGDTIIEFSDDPESVFFYILWYIGYNPVRSHYVQDPRDYPYSSINCYLDKNYKSPVKITLHDFFIKLGSKSNERVKKLLESEEQYRKRIFSQYVYA